MLPTFLLHPRLVNKATITRFHTETQISSPHSLATLLPHYGADAVANLYRGTVPVTPGHHKPFSRWIGNMLGTCDLLSLPALTCWPASTQLVEVSLQSVVALETDTSQRSQGKSNRNVGIGMDLTIRTGEFWYTPNLLRVGHSCLW